MPRVGGYGRNIEQPTGAPQMGDNYVIAGRNPTGVNNVTPEAAIR